MPDAKNGAGHHQEEKEKGMTDRENKSAMKKLTELAQKSGVLKETDIHKKIDKCVWSFEEFTEFENKLIEMGFKIEKTPIPETVNIDGIDVDEKTALYISEINTVPVISEEESRRLAKLASEGDSESKKNLAEAYLRLCAETAKDYLGYGLSYLELILEGNAGIIKSVNEYDPSTEWKFSSYIAWQINWHICRAILNRHRLLCALPRVHLVELAEPAKAELREKLGREPTWEELEQRLDEIMEERNKTVFD